ncbi:surface protease GP63 [Trypanosoma theileri]|uniref:Leishmanolysin-like peptidase n=1 Tax=Trypanosoma theileri TaxID=67003 RepID=A0A1X0NMV0_9TRYP|nr:surface protease GP63 [Trypanosoma theileri]ORC85921.1 surface protease GP63 [Trypanosoma theileri]
MTDVKKKTLLRDVLPAALKLHSERLNVDPVKDMLKLPFKEEYPYLPNCTNASIPKDHRKKGISNADFMLYVGLTEKYVPVQICSKNEKDRPTSALIKFVPEEIDDTRYFIRFAAHEVAHALGFDIEIMKEHKVIVKENTGKTFSLVTSNTVLDEKMKEQYDCSNDGEIKGMPLQSEPTKDAPPHWKRLIAKDELMSPYTPDDKYVTGAYYTALTLAVFHSMPFYKADFKMAESMSWGKNAGCDFLKGKGKEEYKGTKPTKYAEMFCDEVNPALQCTSDRFALGMCSKKPSGVNIPLDYVEHFNTVLKDTDDDLMDGYSIIKPTLQTSCEGHQFNLMPGSVLGKESRCLKGKELKLKTPNEDNLTVGDICAKVKCKKDTNKVLVKYSDTTDWQECEDGGKIDVKDSKEFASGSILCPNYTEVCNDFPVVKDINFTIEYDEDEKERIKKEEKEDEDEMEKEEKQHEEEEENEKTLKDAQPEQESPVHPDPKLNTSSKPDEAPKDREDSQELPAAEVTENQRDSPREGVKEVLSPLAVPEPQPAGEENQTQNTNNNNRGALPQEPSSISAPKVPSKPVKTPEVEKKPTTEISKPVASEPIAVSGHTPSVEEDHNNTTENIQQVQETITDSPSQDGNDEGINTTVDPTLDPNSPSPDDEKNETIVNTDNNTTNTTSSISENVNASATVPATLTGPNKTQMGQVINQATTIAIAGTDSSIATSYQIPLLLIVCALVALASP